MHSGPREKNRASLSTRRTMLEGGGGGGGMSTRIRRFFFRKYFFADAKILASTRSVSESFSAVHTYPIVSGNFLICSSVQF